MVIASLNIRMWNYWDIRLNKSNLRKEKGVIAEVVSAIKL